MATTMNRPPAVGWSQYADEYHPGYSPEATKYQEDLLAKTEEVENLKRVLEEERLGKRLAGINHEKAVTSLSSELTMLKLERETDRGKAKREVERAMDALGQANMAYNILLAQTNTLSTDAFARKSVKALHNALTKCRLLQGCPEATKPQGWVSLDYLSCVPCNGVYISVLPLDAGDDKSQFDWKAIRQGLYAQLIKLRSHLAETTMEYYSEGSDLPELDVLIRCLSARPRSPTVVPP
jgi:hypothetical protein